MKSKLNFVPDSLDFNCLDLKIFSLKKTHSFSFVIELRILSFLIIFSPCFFILFFPRLSKKDKKRFSCLRFFVKIFSEEKKLNSSF